MYEKASFIFWITLILYIITLVTVSYVGVYLTYIAIPIIVISGLIMKFFEPNSQSKKIINTTKLTLKTVNNATNTFLNESNSLLDEINSSLEKTNLINKKTRPLKDKIHKLKMKKFDNELNNKKTITEDIANEISTLKNQIRNIEKQHS